MKDKKLKDGEENGFIAVFVKCPICKKDVLCMGDHPETHDKECLMKFKEENEMHIAHCKKCNQITNRNKEGECLKCKKEKIGWEEMLNTEILYFRNGVDREILKEVNEAVLKKDVIRIVKKAQEEEREYYFEQLGKILDSMEKHKDCEKCYKLILHDMGVRTSKKKEMRDDSKPWSSEEMIEMSSKFAINVPKMDTVIPINYVRIIKNQVKEEEREKIQDKIISWIQNNIITKEYSSYDIEIMIKDIFDNLGGK